MHPESPSNEKNEKNKSKQRFSGRRRGYVDTFRWGFVPEDEASGKIVPQSNSPKANSSRATPEKSGVKKTEPKKSNRPVKSAPVKNVPPAVAAPDSPPKSERNRQRKKADDTTTTESTATAPAAPKKKTSKSGPSKHSMKAPAGRSPKQPVSGNRLPKGKGRTKAVLPHHIADYKYDDDDDLKLPSYGRTPVPTDDELPVPRNIQKVRPPKQSSREERSASEQPEGIRPPAPDVLTSDVAPGGFRPRREQMVWDPDKLEYVPLVIPEKPKEGAPKKSAKPERPATQTKKQDKRQERTAEPVAEKPVSKKPAERTLDKTTEKPKRERPPRREESRHRESRGDLANFVDSSKPDPADIESEVSGFAELGVSAAMLEALKIVRYLEPTPIQAGVFQKVQAGVDLMGQAQTGTGKTAAFSMPIIEGVEMCPPGNDPIALILVPTRELAVQVRDEATRLAYGRDIRVTACYGGKPLAKQIERLRHGIDILVGTPGRILDLMNRRALSLDSLRWVVLDEADRMLDIGFRPDIEKILRRTPQERQTLLFSATLPAPVVRLAEKYMKSPEVLDFSSKSVAVETIEQFYVTVDPERKFDALVYLLEEQQPQQAIIFTRTKRGADRLARLLTKRFDKLAAIHGDLQQSERDRVMAQVRAGSIKYLVATDVVGRGIDVSTVSHIINYDIPKFCDDYVHRVGRTGRMGRDGVAFTFVTVQEGSELTRIEMRIDKLLKRAELKGFESFTKPHDPNATLEEDLPEPPKPVFGKPVRKVRRAL